MILKKHFQSVLQNMLAGAVACLAFSLPAATQVQKTQTVEHWLGVQQIKIDRCTIEYLSGNDVVAKMADGSLEHFDVPDSTTVEVEGKQLNVRQLKVGMTIETQIITTTTPRLITTVETVTGKVWHVNPPTTVTLTLENGENQTFKIPKDQKFTVNGEETDAWGLKKGMMVTATRITDVEDTIVSQEIKHTGVMPAPASEPKQGVPILIATSPETPAPVESAAKTETATTQLPKTASELPFIGFLGALFCGLSLMMTAIRKLIA